MIDNTQKDINKNEHRPPIVVVLGHVDHGKTTLLDAIRKTKIVDKESGGITQHIGAYQAQVSGRLITFLDTPGHEAFMAIRSRGARVADIAILVVAADEGVKPQTKEAIRIIKDEKIPLIVAINKIDKEGANPQKVKQDLASDDILLEDWGGQIPSVEISAKQNKNIDELLEMVFLVADIEDLKNDTSLPAEGLIIESHLDKRRGFVATALIRKGILKIGDWITVGNIVGKVKSMEDFLAKPVGEAVPSQPVQIIGWQSSPGIGEELRSSENKDKAEAIAADRADFAPLFQSFAGNETSGEDKKIFKIIFKSDVSSSLEAIEASLKAIISDEVACQVVSYDIGNIGENDIKMAVSTGAEIIGFRVIADSSAKKMAEKENIKVVSFDIIYELIEYIRKEMSEMLEPEVRQVPLGKLKILGVFKSDSRSQIVGGKVISGKIIRGAIADVIRNKNKLLTGKINQLQHNKAETNEVKEGLECGLKFEMLKDQPKWDIKEGDVLDIYQEEKIARNL